MNQLPCEELSHILACQIKIFPAVYIPIRPIFYKCQLYRFKKLLPMKTLIAVVTCAYTDPFRILVQFKFLINIFI